MSDPEQTFETVAQPEIALPSPQHLRALHNPQSPEWVEAEDVIATRFVQCGYYESPEAVQAAHEPYYPRAAMIVSQRDSPAGDGEITAVILAITPNQDVGYKTIDDLTNPEEELTVFGPEQLDWLVSLHEQGLLVDGPAISARELPPGRPRHEKDAAQMNTLRLWGALARFTTDAGATHMLGAMDAKLYEERYELLFDGSTTRLGPAKLYAGTPSIPAAVDVQALLAVRNPIVQAAIVDGYNSLEPHN